MTLHAMSVAVPVSSSSCTCAGVMYTWLIADHQSNQVAYCLLQIPRKAWPGLLRMPDLAGNAGSPAAVEAFVALVRRYGDHTHTSQSIQAALYIILKCMSITLANRRVGGVA